MLAATACLEILSRFLCPWGVQFATILFYHFPPCQGFDDLEGYALRVSAEKATKVQK